MATELASKYTGIAAFDYEKKRRKSWKWAQENDWLREILDSIEIKSVLDAPVGTGRFIPLFNERGVDVTGVDVSGDMLLQCCLKGDADLKQEDIFSIDMPRHDAVVCVRFLNWLSENDLKKAFQALVRLASKYLVVSVTTAKITHKKDSGAYVHSEQVLSELARQHELSIIKDLSRPVSKTATARMILMERCH